MAANTAPIMLYGIGPVHAALRSRRRALHTLYLKEGSRGPALRALEQAARECALRIEMRSTHALGNLVQHGLHQGAVLACGELPTLELEELLAADPKLLVALDQVEDPQNLGSIARSALFFGAAGLIALRQHSAPFSAAASKASAGALEELSLARVGNLAQALETARNAGLFVLGAVSDDEGVALDALTPPSRCLLVLGAEGQGLRSLTRRRCDQLIRIEGAGLDSLNVGVAAGILLHRLRTNPSLSRGPESA